MKDKRNKTISILGCGWLGLPLAERFAQESFNVKGSTTTQEKLEKIQEAGGKAFIVEISDIEVKGNDLNDFFDADIIIVNFPPRRRADIEENYPAQFEAMLPWLVKKPDLKVLLVSSTSVYPNLNQKVDENFEGIPQKSSGKALLKVENMLKSHKGEHMTVLRLAGLIGPERLPGRFLAGKKSLKNGNVPVNVIHRDDCLEIISQIVEQDAWGKTYNGCALNHPIRKDYYQKAAEAIGLEPPEFADEDEVSYKIVDGSKVLKELDITLKYPDPEKIS
ncbi:NAD(P)-binding domain-containing protein [Aureibacter tunicatorum]|uniref:Nucleoside-diphosphate-sugar epimerase n=1 Tax=Aureibacter tunicatorum TaxID=866807 RepID=A0AAE3XIY1_9BACT|nr:SDR family NAD(P)-dependent oxidoreductase [Aureibacter tunicatorum]MDR6237573.1 nucleoside-diphosphate-sugar epimerase [Aureibacter tunicatorum]